MIHRFPLILLMGSLASCSSPFAGPDAFDAGLSELLKAKGEEHRLKAMALAHVAPTPPLPSKPTPSRLKSRPVKAYADQPNDDGRFLPLPTPPPPEAAESAPPPALVPWKGAAGS
jgi:hypothetical protein